MAPSSEGGDAPAGLHAKTMAPLRRTLSSDVLDDGGFGYVVSRPAGAKPISRLFHSFIAPMLGALALWACEEAAAPSAPGVCWRAPSRAAGPRRFEVLARNVDTLEDCAAELEAVHLQQGVDVQGAFQGVFIFIDARKVGSAARAGDFAYPIFQPGQRVEIDSDLKRLIRDRNGALPSAADIAVERK
ncbi:MAG: hypothetical protein ACYC8V_13300 [Caulobacteraceae bacterium]